MNKINAVITGISASVPDYILTNGELSELVETSDEWITTRVGIKERRILKGEGQGISVLGTNAAKKLLEKTNTNPEEIDVVIFATTTPDHLCPSTASIVAENLKIKNAFCFDMEAACSGFLFSLEVAQGLIKTGKYKKIILLSGDKLSAFTNYKDRTTCTLFGDSAGAVLIEPTFENIGIIDSILKTDGIGYNNLIIKSGGSKYPTNDSNFKNSDHTIYQEGKVVFKHAVNSMSNVSKTIIERNNLSIEDISWLVPHQANLRIIDAVINYTGIPKEKVIINIEKYGNSSAGTIPLCLSQWESKFKKGDNIILTAFGAGFTWGSLYLKWGYDSK